MYEKNENVKSFVYRNRPKAAETVSSSSARILQTCSSNADVECDFGF